MPTHQSVDAPEYGVVLVTFDAGAEGGSVNCNPQSFRLIQDTPPYVFRVEWVMQPPVNTDPEYQVSFGNVVPAASPQPVEGYHLESELLEGAPQLTWRWTFTSTGENSTPPQDLKPAAILYDIFFVYQPKGTSWLISPIGPPGAGVQSLRSVLGTDPTLRLPPKKSGDGHDSDGKPGQGKPPRVEP